MTWYQIILLIAGCEVVGFILFYFAFMKNAPIQEEEHTTSPKYKAWRDDWIDEIRRNLTGDNLALFNEDTDYWVKNFFDKGFTAEDTLKHILVDEIEEEVSK